MKILTVATIVLGLFTSLVSSAAPIATALGSPDANVDFVQKIVSKRISLGSGEYDQDWTTRLFSVLTRQKFSSAVAVETIGAGGAISLADLIVALNRAAEESPVVYTAVGGSADTQNNLCKHLSQKTDNVFVLAAGKSSEETGAGQEPDCAAPNIIRVAALNEELTDLNVSSNFGSTIRVAAPGTNISVIGAGGVASTMTGTSVASAHVAGFLAHVAEHHPELKGRAIIDHFLDDHTVRLEKLDGKVVGGRAFIP